MALLVVIKPPKLGVFSEISATFIAMNLPPKPGVFCETMAAFPAAIVPPKSVEFFVSFDFSGTTCHFPSNFTSQTLI